MRFDKPIDKPLKPAEFAEKQLLSAIINSTYRPGEALPAERALSIALGVTRPTLRETLQRLSREGWVTIQHGKSTIVNDYLKSGGLGTLKSLVSFGNRLSDEMVSHLLQVRSTMMPGIANWAVKQNPEDLLDYLNRAKNLNDRPNEVAIFDWGLQMAMVNASGNPVFRMIVNDFTPIYRVLGERYFKEKKARDFSFAYYVRLETAIQNGAKAVETLVRETMEQTHQLWQQMIKE